MQCDGCKRNDATMLKVSFSRQIVRFRFPLDIDSLPLTSSLKIYYAPRRPPRRESKSQIAMKTSRPLRSNLGPLDMHNWEFLHRRELSLPNIILPFITLFGSAHLVKSLTSDVTIQVR